MMIDRDLAVGRRGGGPARAPLWSSRPTHRVTRASADAACPSAAAFASAACATAARRAPASAAAASRSAAAARAASPAAAARASAASASDRQHSASSTAARSCSSTARSWSVSISTICVRCATLAAMAGRCPLSATPHPWRRLEGGGRPCPGATHGPARQDTETRRHEQGRATWTVTPAAVRGPGGRAPLVRASTAFRSGDKAGRVRATRAITPAGRANNSGPASCRPRPPGTGRVRRPSHCGPRRVCPLPMAGWPARG
jgi:hypothetical protein